MNKLEDLGKVVDIDSIPNTTCIKFEILGRSYKLVNLTYSDSDQKITVDFVDLEFPNMYRFKDYITVTVELNHLLFLIKKEFESQNI